VGLLFMMCGLMVRLTVFSVRLMIIGCVWTVKLMALLFTSCVAMLGGSSHRVRH
jgi:hypothetical protein